MGVLRTLTERRREMWATALMRVYAERRIETGDVYGHPMPAGKYPEGDPRNDPEYERRAQQVGSLVKRYVGTDIPSIVAEANKRRKKGKPLSSAELAHRISLYRNHQRDLQQGVGGATDELWDRLPVGDTGAPVGWQPERAALHQRLLDRFEADAVARGVPRDRRAIVMGGPTGAGKSSMLKDPHHARELGVTYGDDGKINSHVVINPDDFKDMIVNEPGALDFGRYEGLSPGEMASIVHEESSHLAKLAAQRMMSKGYNVIHDITLNNDESARKKYVDGWDGRDEQHPAYHFTHAFVDGEMSASRHNAGLRYKFRNGNDDVTRNYGGRFVDAPVIESQAPTQPGYRTANAEASERFSALPQISDVYAYDPVTGRGGWRKRNGQGTVSHRHSDGPAQIAASRVSLEEREARVTVSAITDKVRQFHAGQITREALVRYLAHEHTYSPPPERIRHDIADLHADKPDSDWYEVEHAHQAGLLPHDIYMDVLKEASVRHSG